MSTDVIVEGQALMDQAIVWIKTANPEYPFTAKVKDYKCKVRINDFPADNLYTLIVNGKESANFDDWPSQWTRPRATKSQDNFTLVAEPDGRSSTLYAIPEDVLEQYKLSPEKAAHVLLNRDERSMEEAILADEIMVHAERNSPKLAQIILLLHVDGLSWDEIAVRLEVRKETLRTLYNRGLIKLREKLDDTGS